MNQSGFLVQDLILFRFSQKQQDGVVVFGVFLNFSIDLLGLRKGIVHQYALQAINTDLDQIFHDHLVLQLPCNVRIIIRIVLAECSVEGNDDHSAQHRTSTVFHSRNLVRTEDQLYKRLEEEQIRTFVFCLQHVTRYDLLEVCNGFSTQEVIGNIVTDIRQLIEHRDGCKTLVKLIQAQIGSILHAQNILYHLQECGLTVCLLTSQEH